MLIFRREMDLDCYLKKQNTVLIMCVCVYVHISAAAWMSEDSIGFPTAGVLLA